MQVEEEADAHTYIIFHSPPHSHMHLSLTASFLFMRPRKNIRHAITGFHHQKGPNSGVSSNHH